MFGIGASELVLIVIVALIVVGPKNLPITLRAVGRAIAEFRRASRELRKQVGYDEVVDEVTRPLREGMAGIEKDVLNLKDRVEQNEYPPGGPDDYGAVPESATMYPNIAPMYSKPLAKQLEETVARTVGTIDLDGGKES